MRCSEALSLLASGFQGDTEKQKQRHNSSMCLKDATPVTKTLLHTYQAHRWYCSSTTAALRLMMVLSKNPVLALHLRVLLVYLVDEAAR